MSDSTVKIRPTRTELLRFTLDPAAPVTNAADMLTELIYSAQRAIVDMDNAGKWVRSFDGDDRAQLIAEHLEVSRRFLEKAAESMDAWGWTDADEEA